VRDEVVLSKGCIYKRDGPVVESVLEVVHKTIRQVTNTQNQTQCMCQSRNGKHIGPQWEPVGCYPSTRYSCSLPRPCVVCFVVSTYKH